MKTRIPATLLVTILSTLPLMPRAGATQGEEVHNSTRDPLWDKVWSKISLSTLWYLSYGWGESGGDSFNQARIGRGYVTFKFKPFQWFQPRVTLDTHQDDSGDWKVRLKYMYGKFVLPVETAVITEPNLEFGLVHGPWFDYEEHINYYRIQGTMFIERNGVLNSADAGITVGALLGRRLDEEYQKKVNSKYPGTWGSLAFGLYNGGGYHAEEQNENKTFESRLSVRPLGFVLPNLTLSHFFIWGKGNTAQEPDWRLNAFMASFEHEYFVATAQYATGEGNQKGTRLDASGMALENQGVSGFLEIKLPWIDSRIIGRYDWWEWGDASSARLIAGVAYYFMKHSFFLLDLDRVSYDDPAQPDRPVDWQVKLTLQVHVP